MKVAWFTHFPVEWLEGAPAEVARLPKGHPGTWQRVLLSRLRQRPDVELHVIALRKTFSRSCSFQLHGVTFHLVKTIGGLRAPTFFLYDTLLVGAALRSIGPDVVHAWGTENGAALVASRLRWPAVVTVQGLSTWMVETFPMTRYERLAARLEGRSIRRSHLVTAESRFACAFIRQRFPGPEVRHIDVVPDPLFAAVKREPPAGPPRFLYVGALGLRKGADVMVQALSRLAPEFDFELRIIGRAEAGFVEAMRRETHPLVWKRMTFRTDLTPSEMAGELSGATLLLCPTRADTGPMAVKEAVVAGLPVVGSDIGGVPDYVYPDENGYLAAAGDVSGFEARLRLAISHPLFGTGRVDPERLRQSRHQLSAETMEAGFWSAYESCRSRWHQANPGSLRNPPP